LLIEFGLLAIFDAFIYFSNWNLFLDEDANALLIGTGYPIELINYLIVVLLSSLSFSPIEDISDPRSPKIYSNLFASFFYSSDTSLFALLFYLLFLLISFFLVNTCGRLRSNESEN